MKSLEITKHFLELNQVHLAILRSTFLRTLLLSFLHPWLLLVAGFLLFEEYLHHIETLWFLVLIKSYLLWFHPNNCGVWTQIEFLHIEKLLRDTILVDFEVVLLQQHVTGTSQISIRARIRLKTQKVHQCLVELSLPTKQVQHLAHISFQLLLSLIKILLCLSAYFGRQHWQYSIRVRDRSLWIYLHFEQRGQSVVQLHKISVPLGYHPAVPLSFQVLYTNLKFNVVSTLRSDPFLELRSKGRSVI